MIWRTASGTGNPRSAATSASVLPLNSGLASANTIFSGPPRISSISIVCTSRTRAVSGCWKRRTICSGPPSLRPAGDRVGAQARHRGRVDVLRARHLESLRARRIDDRGAFRGTSVEGGPLRVEVAEDGAEAGFRPDVDRLANRIVVTDPLVRGAEIPVVRVVDRGVLAADRILRRDPSEFDHLVGLRVVPGRVEQSGGEPEGAVLHSLSDKRLHLVEFSRGGIAVVHADDGPSHGAVSDVGDDVLSDAGRFEVRVERGEVRAARAVDPDDAGRDPLGEEFNRRGARTPRRGWRR